MGCTRAGQIHEVRAHSTASQPEPQQEQPFTQSTTFWCRCCLQSTRKSFGRGEQEAEVEFLLCAVSQNSAMQSRCLGVTKVSAPISVRIWAHCWLVLTREWCSVTRREIKTGLIILCWCHVVDGCAERVLPKSLMSQCPGKSAQTAMGKEWCRRTLEIDEVGFVIHQPPCANSCCEMFVLPLAGLLWQAENSSGASKSLRA